MENLFVRSICCCWDSFSNIKQLLFVICSAENQGIKCGLCLLEYNVKISRNSYDIAIRNKSSKNVPLKVHCFLVLSKSLDT